MDTIVADRDLSKLEANFRSKVSAFLAEVGREIFVTEGFRTQQRQDYLYSLGRTQPGKIVTWTKESLHEKGKAIDIAFL
jgi:D-alanyl-D-alanine dipeptidase